jgi:type VI secretion system secreted protein VgrG
MANFDKIIPIILEQEGRFVNNPNDAGGVTNFGISYRFLKGLPEYSDITPDFIVKLNAEEASKIYQKYFWDPNQYISIFDSDIACKIFSLCVNIGSKSANLILQKSLNDVDSSALIDEDGIIGDTTIRKVNLLLSRMKKSQILINIVYHAVKHYLNIVNNHQEQMVFLRGWLNRIYS